MAEIIFQRRKAATIFMEPSPVLIIILVFLQMCSSQVINRVPHFVPQTGDMSTFSLAEDTPVGTPVYQLKGIDPDNGPLRYSISGQYFTVDPVTGVVTLARKLDREEMESLELVISITDEGIANTEPNTISLRRVIPVKDINDNPPVFHNRPYIVNISEATAVGTEIEVSPNIIVTDDDEGDNAKIVVTCTPKERGSDAEACATFRIDTHMITPNKYQVRIFLATALDFESRTAYIISLEAHDSSARPLRSLASVSAAVRDVQDQPPLFLNAPYSATVAENTPQDVSIMEIMAKDGDTANQRPVLLTLEGDVLNYFRLLPDRPMGRATLVTTDVPIDRESDVVIQNGGVYSFSVKATELINNEVPSDFTVIPITIIVTDVDDHIPKFNKDTFDISIPENIENGSPIPGLSIYVEDIDLGENSRYNLHLRDVYNSEGVFSLTTTRGEGRAPISVKVKDSSKLDYDVYDDDKRMFSFDIVTSVNGEELSYARVNVKLLDVNDNGPIFKEQNYKFNVLENSPIETKLGEVQATDKDYGIFGELEYSLSGFGSNFFKTDINKGGIYVARELDYESQKSYSLTLFAKDGGGKISSTSIFIEVLDENDNMPMFEALEYTRTIREGATSFEPLLVVRATDIDGPSQGGGRVRYTIESDNSIEHRGRVFSIDEDNGEITIDNKVESMDTPRGQYELVVRATDYGVPPLYNETRVLIRVGVPGNQRPTFKGNYHHYKYTVNQKDPDNNEDYTFDINPMNYKATIREDARPGQNVTAVVANDPDGLDDLLTYHIVSGSKDNFIINEKTGLITISNDANLDRDTNTDRYEIIVSAVDSGLPQPETATTTVFVNILDVNDKPPQFNTTDSTTYISERKPIGEIVTVLTAFDTDSTAKLKYTIIEPIKAFSRAGVQLKPNAPYDYKTIFSINEDNGEISVSGKLDYSQVSVVILTVKVVDINAELNKEEQFAITEYTIYIQPYTDNNPQFINPGWTITNPIIYHKIKEEQPIGSTVLVLMAEDPTSGHMVSNFKVVNSETGLLQVDPLSGQVVLTRHLDYEELKTPNLTLTVHAVSNDGSKHSSAKIIIEVMNVNDNPPIFDKELYKVSVLESIQYPEQVGVVKAEDKDAVLSAEDKEKGYADVRYVLRGDNRELFVIDNVTGVIKVAPNKTLDRERQSVLRVEVEAYDTPRGGVDRLKSVAVVLIDVLDVDDNAPTFDKSVYTAVIPENVAVGTSVVKLLATDPDEGLGGEIKYEFLDEGEANGLFTIDTDSGVVRSGRPLTGRGRTEPYRVLAGARDGGGHVADTSLQIYVGDVSANDGVPTIIRPARGESLHIAENSPVGSVVFQVVASDPDDPSQPSGQLSLSLQQTDVFAIDPDTGVITTRQALDRERTAAYTLVLSVTDRGQPPQQTTRIVTVDVTDVDDHKPHFARNLDDPPVLLTTYEEVPIGSIIGTLAAVDEDIGENAAIDYIITAGNELEYIKLERSNDSKAVLRAAAGLDREVVARILLTVKCFKLGSVPRINRYYNRLDPSEIQITIKILDIDDHLPEFETSNMTIGVRLNAPIDTVIATIKAIDKDPEALAIDYSLVNMSFESPIKSRSINNITDVIVVNNRTGALKIMKNLIHYADGTFKFTFRANNSNDTERHADLPVEVVVVRERDLLRLVVPTGRAGRSRLAALKQRIAGALQRDNLRLQMHDATHDAFYDTMGPCFQFRKMDTGEALTPMAMKAAIRALGVEFQKILQEYEVHNITGCGVSRSRHSTSQYALLGVASALPLAAALAALMLCSMHSTAKRRMRSSLLLSREPPPGSMPPAPLSQISVPTRLYAEPLYST
ncbi:cadherin-23 [Leptidea sinapis]|uniref:cadherin-23 n=1 Tax=Leptidea sinapis TaxID=189913 RepID=UPI0021394946|nr:cadherin-23 [Leptidea sinapis]